MFFKDTPDFKKYYGVSAGFNFDLLTVHLKDVDRTELKRYMGPDFLAELQEAFDSGLLEDETPTPEEVIMIEAIELVRRCTPFLALAKWVPGGQLTIDNIGLSITVNDNRKMPWEWQVKEFVKSLNNSGAAAMDDLLEYLDKNLETFDTYAASDEFKTNRELFVNSSAVFAKFYSAIAGSRVTFYKLKSIIRKVEDFEIKEALLPDYYKELKDLIKSGDAIDEDSQAVINLVQPAVVNLAIARAISELSASLTDDNFLQFDNTGSGGSIDLKGKAGNDALIRIQTIAESDGRAYLKQITDLLKSDATTYATYAADEAHEAESDFDSEQNDGSSNIFNAH